MKAVTGGGQRYQIWNRPLVTAILWGNQKRDAESVETAVRFLVVA